MNYNILNTINSPDDLKKLTLSELKEYAFELRAYITSSVLVCGGHLASSLGAVEIAVALHYIFNTPQDKIIYDVGHQCYAHKIITGRREEFKKLRTDEGVSGFLKPSESEYDSFISGHSSTSISVAAGFLKAKKLKGSNEKVISVIGDGALTGGMVFEALNDIGAMSEKTIIILNDNEMSISKNVGALSNHFTKLRISRSYLKFKSRVKRVVSAIPFFGKTFFSVLDKSRKMIKSITKTNKMFEQMGINYHGPFDGNDLETLISVLKQADNIQGPVLVHLLTKKGCGFIDAEKNPSDFHGVSSIYDDKNEKSFSNLAGETLVELASKDDKICAISAAMISGTGLSGFSDKFPDRLFDVGIAESHAVTMAAATAKEGLKPFVAIYSSFLQRAFDQIIHDVAICNLPVTFLIDRAGVIGSDGVTHQGVFDIAYLNLIPNLTILSPSCGVELVQMLKFACDFNAPLAIRYPKSFANDYNFGSEFKLGEWQTLKTEKNNKYILAVGNRMLDIANEVKGTNIINASTIKQLDEKFLNSLKGKNASIITLEDGALKGGFGQSVLSFLNQNDINCKVKTLGIGDNFVLTHSIKTAFENEKLDSKYLQSLIDGL